MPILPDTATGFLNAVAGFPADHLPLLMLTDHLEESHEGHDQLIHTLRYAVPKLGETRGIAVDPHTSGDPLLPRRTTSYLVNRSGAITPSPGFRDHPVLAVRSGGPHIAFYTPTHSFYVPVVDPTFRLLREYRKNRPMPGDGSAGDWGQLAISRYEAKRHPDKRVLERWDRAHAILSELAFHHIHFGNEVVGRRLRKLLTNRGQVTRANVYTYPSQRYLPTLASPRYNDHEYETTGNGVLFDRKRRGLTVTPGPKGSPTRLQRTTP